MKRRRCRNQLELLMEKHIEVVQVRANLWRVRRVLGTSVFYKADGRTRREAILNYWRQLQR